MLREEELTFDVHKSKKCSFITSRPQVWTKTIENHLRDLVNPYFSSKYKSHDGQYLEYTLYYNGDETKKVRICVYVKTGVILIQGEHFQYWAEKVFPLLKEQVKHIAIQGQSRYGSGRPEKSVLKRSNSGRAEKSVLKRSNSLYRISNEDAVGKVRSKSVGNLTIIGKNSPTVETDEEEAGKVNTCHVEKSAAQNENVNLRTVLQSIEKDYEALYEELEMLDYKTKKKNDEFDKIRQLGGEKASLRMKKLSDVSKCSGMHVEAKSNQFPESKTDLESQIKKMRGQLIENLSEIKGTIQEEKRSISCKCHLLTDLADIQRHIASVQQLVLCDIETLKERLEELNISFANIKAVTQSAETVMNIKTEQKVVQTNVDSIRKSLEEMRTKMMLAWDDYNIFE